MDYGVNILGLYFLTGDHSPERFYESSYSAWLVLLSYAFAFFGSYVGLVISQQVAAAKSNAAQAAWIAAGAAAMGGGVWSMHFVGMIAYALPFSVGYDITLTSLSVIPSICASAIVLFIISRKRVSGLGLVIGGVLTGAGIGAMHFIGMSAMRAETSMGYDPVLFGLSILVAVLLACLALSVKFRLDSLQSRMASRWANVIGGAVMGLAISGMHYVAMAAARFFPGDLCLAPGATIQADLLAVVVNVFSFMVIGLVLFAAVARKVLWNSSLLSAIFKNSVEGIVITDAHGTITLFSPAAERIFGYRAKEMKGKNIATLMPPAIAAVHHEFMAAYDTKIFSEIMGQNREITAVRKDGIEIPVEIGVSDISMGREILFSATIRDITARKQAELATARARDELEQSLKQQIELNQTQAEFVSMVSHEFRTPLAIIDMTAQRLLRRKGGTVRPDLPERIEKIRGAVKRMAGLMESMLSTATLTAGELRIDLKSCDIRSLVAQACARQRDISKRHSIECDLDRLPPEITADGPAIDQILTNLLSNAVKYSPDNPNIHVTGWQEGGDVFVAVKDHGLGIDEEDLPRMFDKYFRAKTALSIGGTGIGLSLSRQLAKQHGGEITLESKRDVGSTFTLRLPVHPERRDKPETQAAA